MTAKATYELSFEGSDELQGGMFRVVQRPRDRRVDILVEDSKEPLSFLDLGGRLFSCDQQGCAEVSEGESRKPDEGGTSVADRLYLIDITLGFLDSLQEEGLDDTEVEALGDQEVAGLDTECFRGTSDERGVKSTAEICFSKDDGALLKMAVTLTETSGKFLISILATELDYNVTDEDFALPAPLQP